MDDLVKREGLYYKKFSDVPFSGKATGKYGAYTILYYRNGTPKILSLSFFLSFSQN
jgi:hypothetical protein